MAWRRITRPPESVASSASAIARIGWPVRCDAARMRAYGVVLADVLARHQHALGALDDACALSSASVSDFASARASASSALRA